MSKTVTLRLSDEHLSAMTAIGVRLGLSGATDIVRYWCDHGAELLDNAGSSAPKAQLASARPKESGKTKLNPTMQAYADGAAMPKGLYPSLDCRVKHDLRDDRGWALADAKDWIDGKPHYVDPTKRMGTKPETEAKP